MKKPALKLKTVSVIFVGLLFAVLAVALAKGVTYGAASLAIVLALYIAVEVIAVGRGYVEDDVGSPIKTTDV